MEDFLNRYLKHPEHETEALRLNATNILKVLGVPNVSQAEAKQATNRLASSPTSDISLKQSHRTVHFAAVAVRRRLGVQFRNLENSRR